MGYRFRDQTLLQRALTHRSYSSDHNERLEFLGDAVLELAISDLIFQALPKSAEGGLSRLRASLVRESSLHGRAVALGLPAVLRVGLGEAQAGGRHRPSILADALEAIVGAIYLDGGFESAREWVQRLFADVELTPERVLASKDAKTALQEWLQARHLPLPEYQVLQVTGAAHEQRFEVSCTVSSERLKTRASGRSKRAAERDAATVMLERLVQGRREQG